MATKTVNLVVRVPESLRQRVKAIAHLRGETVSDVVREALLDYVAAGETETATDFVNEKATEEEDLAYAKAVLNRIAQGAPTYSHEEVWEMFFEGAQ
ncbi:MAG: hypothetical protein GXP42_12170 [Chloroflexi bacterium]|nr:hypothetical protein [Chloroflexota bacterium]